MESLRTCAMMATRCTHYHHHHPSIAYKSSSSSSSSLRILASSNNGSANASGGAGSSGGGGDGKGETSTKINGTTTAISSSSSSSSSSTMLVPSLSVAPPLSISSLLTQKAAAVFSVASETSYALSEALLSAIAGVAQISTQDTLRQGRLVEGVVYRQTFVVRSYEAGADRTATLETFLNLFQETALNHVLISGLAGDGFGTTREMIRKQLIWVVTRMQVEVESYPAWGDALEIDTWVGASGKNGMRRDWLVRDYKSGAILARATSTWVMMHKSTRRLSKLPDEVRGEITPWFLTRTAFVDDSVRKIVKLDHTSEFIRSGLTPRHSDLDMNQHVNNVKYLSWMMESLPSHIFETHQLVGITLEYRRECGKSDVVQSLTHPETAQDVSAIEFTHLLRMENDGSEIVRARTAWRAREQQKHQKQQHTEQL